jgi:protein SCO1/2
MKRRTLGAAALAWLGAHAFGAPTDSVYNLQITLTDQLGQARPLDTLRGRPVLITMFYTSCQMVCPMIVEAIRATEQKLTPEQRDKLAVLMVSFDTERDTVPVLKATADKRGLAAPHWTLARSDAKSVRRLAAVLGIQYRPTADGEFNHSSTLLLLDGEGRIAARTNQISGADPAMVARIKALVA